jgi:hypothetical protein
MQLLTYHPFGYNAILLHEMNSLPESQTIERKFWVEAWIGQYRLGIRIRHRLKP